jgi:hypothetical protein
LAFHTILVAKPGADFDRASIEVGERQMKVRALGGIRRNTREPFGQDTEAAK